MKCFGANILWFVSFPCPCHPLWVPVLIVHMVPVQMLVYIVP